MLWFCFVLFYGKHRCDRTAGLIMLLKKKFNRGHLLCVSAFGPVSTGRIEQGLLNEGGDSTLSV